MTTRFTFSAARWALATLPIMVLAHPEPCGAVWLQPRRARQAGGSAGTMAALLTLASLPQPLQLVFDNVPPNLRTELWLSQLHRGAGKGAAAAAAYASLLAEVGASNWMAALPGVVATPCLAVCLPLHYSLCPEQG
jgi:hypothetical protein